MPPGFRVGNIQSAIHLKMFTLIPTNFTAVFEFVDKFLEMLRRNFRRILNTTLIIFENGNEKVGHFAFFV